MLDDVNNTNSTETASVSNKFLKKLKSDAKSKNEVADIMTKLYNKCMQSGRKFQNKLMEDRGESW